MTEGPEIKLLTNKLRHNLVGRKFVNLDIIKGPYITAMDTFFTTFREKCIGLKKIIENKNNFVKIETVECKGKKIYIELCIWRPRRSTNPTTSRPNLADVCEPKYIPTKYVYLLISLGTKGILRKDPSEHSQISIEYTDDSPSAGNQQTQHVYFEDTRQIGRVEIINGDIMDNIIDSMGVDVMSDEFTLDCFITCLNRYPYKTIAAFLIDQSAISGIGVIYRSEILYIAKINPFDEVILLNLEQITKLHAAIRYITLYAFLQGGIKNGSNILPTLPTYYEPLIYGREITKKGEKVHIYTLSKRTIYSINNVSPPPPNETPH